MNETWQKTMYDLEFAQATIASREYEKLARDEARFLMQSMALSPGDRLLDAPCGTGRHARLFAARGIAVTGLDINPLLIRMAKRKSGGPDYKVGDLLSLKKYQGRYDAVVNLFTSFGYFSTESKNREVMKGLIGALKPRGRIAFNLIDRDWLLKHFKPNSWSEKNGVFTLEARSYDSNTQIIESRTVLVNRTTGKAKDYFHRTRLYTKSEMVKLMKECGVKRVDVYGDTDGSSFRRYETSHPTYIGWV